MNTRDDDPNRAPTDGELPAWAEAPPPRRTDDAFARAVHAGVAARRGALGARTLLVGAPLLAGAIALAVVVLRDPGAASRADAHAPGNVVAAAPDGATDTDTDTDTDHDDGEGALALVAEDPLFAIPAVDGSEEELARLDQALDVAIEGARNRARRSQPTQKL